MTKEIVCTDLKPDFITTIFWYPSLSSFTKSRPDRLSTSGGKWRKTKMKRRGRGRGVGIFRKRYEFLKVCGEKSLQERLGLQTHGCLCKVEGIVAVPLVIFLTERAPYVDPLEVQIQTRRHRHKTKNPRPRTAARIISILERDRPPRVKYTR